MTQVSVQVGAAIARVAAVIAPLLSGEEVQQIAKMFKIRRLETDDGTSGITSMLTMLWLRGRAPHPQVESAILTLAMAAHNRTVAGQGCMTEAHVDDVVWEMRTLGLRPGQLAQRRWRKGLSRTGVMPAPPTVGDAGVREEKPATSPTARVHEAALLRIQELVTGSLSPQARGRELERVVVAVLRDQGLAQVERDVRTSGEQLDVAFVLGDVHYLVECKWERDPVGLPVISAFSAKVSRKAEGTFGIVLSMSGFVADINEKVNRGARLNCLGITGPELMTVLEGRETWAHIVRRKRAQASTRSLFFSSQ